MATTPESAERPAQRIPAKLSDAVLRRFVFQTFGRTRRTQDSPIVPDVWLSYIRVAESIARARIRANANASAAPASLPSAAIDLLLTPWSGTTPGYIAKALRDRLTKRAEHESPKTWEGKPQAWVNRTARIAQSTSRVVATIDFLTLVRDVVPLTGWWQKLSLNFGQFRVAFQKLWQTIEHDSSLAKALSVASTDRSFRSGEFIEFLRYAVLVGFIDRLMNAGSPEDLDALAKLARLLGPRAAEYERDGNDADTEGDDKGLAGAEDDDAADGPHNLGLKELAPLLEGYVGAMADQADAQWIPEAAEVLRSASSEPKGIFLVNLNRPASQSLFESSMTVKADAAHRLFDINTEGIVFAVVDGGIDARHPAFLKRSMPEVAARVEKGKAFSSKELLLWSRVTATFDFTLLRDIIACQGDPMAATDTNKEKITQLSKQRKYKKAFRHLQIRNEYARDLDWDIVNPLIRVPHEDRTYEGPGNDHGTHVAGILAADLPHPDDMDRPLRGMCRGLSIYDLRVFDREGRGDEFAILAALEFVGWLNRDRSNPVVHGVNLSLALAHDVDSFACGQTPVCEVCNHLVGTGTVVVAAAGNTGFAGATNKQSIGNGYRAISITDPGNADRVITVGSTHRRDPHAYGVSYFSARGPTGDGRCKPDLLAPGEKITSTIREGRTQRMDGTSMAAPHVSGAAALLMARYPELIGHPSRIKEILMKSATDLKREPSFQGAGLLDVLRALQSV